MEPNVLYSDQYTKLKEAIFDILLQYGMKKTTMDMVASTLSMSKRTLYEIFDSKEEMIKIILEFHHQRYIALCAKTFKESANVMEALYLILKWHKILMKNANSCFFQDMDSTYSKMRPVYDDQADVWAHKMLDAIELGKRQNVFRPDINYPVLIRMLRIQMESLKRMEEFLPSSVTLSEAYDTIIMSFLRSIASNYGSEVLEETILKHSNEFNENEI